MAPPDVPDVLIIGGGIAGLTAAYELHRRRVPFLLLERAARSGGVILSEDIDGFTIDAGPDSLLIQKPEAIALCEELGLGERLVTTKLPRVAYIQRRGVLYPLPAGSVLGVPTEVGPFLRSGLFSWAGKLRMGAELFVPPNRDGADESIGAFMTRRFGREATTYLAEPLLAGIHAGDVDRLSLRALFPRFAKAEQEYGSLLRAFHAQRRRAVLGARERDRDGATVSARGAGPEARSVLNTCERDGASVSASGGGAPRVISDGAFKSLRGGLSELVRALTAALPREGLQLDTAVQCVSRAATGQGYRVTTNRGVHDTRAVLLASPAFVTASLVNELDAELARLCGEVAYASIATVALAFSRDAIGHPLNGSGYVVPRVEHSDLLAVSWLSSKWPNRAPAGMALLRTFIGGTRSPAAVQMSDAELVSRSLDAVRPMLAIRGEPTLARVYRFERANAQHEVGHLARVAQIDATLAAHPGLFLTGSAYRGVGIPDCVADARATAARLSGWLEQSDTTTAAETARRTR